MTFTFTTVVKAGCEIQFRSQFYAREVLVSRTVAHKRFFSAKCSQVYSESYCNMRIPNLIRGRKVNHSFLCLLPSLGLMGVFIFFDCCDKNLIVLSRQLLIPLNSSKDDNSFVIIFLFLKFEIFVLFLLPTVKKIVYYFWRECSFFPRCFVALGLRPLATNCTLGKIMHFSPSIYNILLGAPHTFYSRAVN
jgi:hypothetical protein